MQPWQWDDAQWRIAVEAVRAGSERPPTAWPNGAGIAVALSFDADHETPWLRDGDTAPGGLSAGEYGARRAMPRLLEMLRQFRVPATFFYPAVSALLHPDELDRVLADGHEIAIHGWIHERPDLLTDSQERDLVTRSLDCLENLTTVRPVGVRAPSFGVSPSSLQIAADAGLLYDSSLMADDDPYEILLNNKPSGLIEIPVDWSRDDAAYFVMDRFSGVRPYPNPRDVLQGWVAEFRTCRDEGGLFQLTLHPDLIGRRSRIAILEELLDEITSSDHVWLATHQQVAAHYLKTLTVEPN